jgi:flagellar biosynthetic protein FlhB
MSGEKTEAATPRRREQALEEGNVWSPRELAPAAALLVAAGLAGLAGAGLWRALMALLAAGLEAAGDAVRAGPEVTLAALLAHLPWGQILMLAVAVMLVTGALAQAAARHASLKLAAPRLSRLSPVKGVQRIFSMQGLAGAATALLKLGLIGAAGVAVLWPLLPGLAVAGEGAGGLAVVGGALQRLLMAVALAMLVVAAADAAMSWRLRESKLRMSRDEVKRESRQENGAPELKAAIRRAQMLASRRRLRGSLAEASVVLVNPVHFAVALRYDPARDGAPVVLEKGREEVALAIMAVARELGRPVVRSPRLARALFFTARLGGPVREELYLAVATVLAFVMQLDADLEAVPEVSVPPAFDLDETGEPRKPGAALPL